MTKLQSLITFPLFIITLHRFFRISLLMWTTSSYKLNLSFNVGQLHHLFFFLIIIQIKVTIFFLFIAKLLINFLYYVFTTNIIKLIIYKISSISRAFRVEYWVARLVIKPSRANSSRVLTEIWPSRFRIARELSRIVYTPSCWSKISL